MEPAGIEGFERELVDRARDRDRSALSAPFQGRDPEDTLSQIIERDPADPRHLRRLGIRVPLSPHGIPEHAIDDILAREDPDSAHSSYNTWIRLQLEAGSILPHSRCPGLGAKRSSVESLGILEDLLGRIVLLHLCFIEAVHLQKLEFA
jgi:hypothetical protein